MRAVGRQCLLLFDGVGMKLGAVLRRKGWVPDVNGTDLFPEVMRLAAARGLRLFFLGGTQEVVQEAVARARARHAGLQVAGFRSGYFGRHQEGEIVERINASGAQLLLVGMGCPLQEAFTLRNLRALEVPVIWQVGGLFDFVSGNKPRAPMLIRRARLEWGFRLALEPRRMWYRYLVVPAWFLQRCLRWRAEEPRG
jgi:exopolysaccharide biosynthesis WecB/TagA/CpsF family protein